MDRMKIEIWSDVMCPFCYIGKRRFEQSLAMSPLKDRVEVEWKSYQLNPDLTTDPTIRIDEYLALHKGMPIEQARQMNQQVTEMAKQEGLVYNFDISVVANSSKAHQMTHFAKRFGKQDQAEELLFKSYFTDGKNVDDVEVLKSILYDLGLDVADFEKELQLGHLEDEVKMDIHEARQIGVTGVPFFVYNRSYAISGAQPRELFDQTLQKAFDEWQSSAQPVIIQADEDANSCGINGCG